MDKYQELISQATVIKNENAPRENTAVRVGTTLINIINAIEDAKKEAAEKVGELNIIVKEKVAVLDESGEVMKTPFSFVSNSEYILAIIDAEQHLLLGIRVDGSTEFAKGVPTPIKKFVEETFKSIDLSNLQSKLSEEQLSAISDVVNKVTKEVGKGLSSNDFTNALKEKLEGINLSLFSTKEETDNKQDKEYGKGLINIDIANCFYISENFEYVYALTDKDDHLLFGIKHSGETEWSVGVPDIFINSVKSALIALIDKKQDALTQEQNDAIDVVGKTFKIKASEEFAFALVKADDEERIIFGIDRDLNIVSALKNPGLDIKIAESKKKNRTGHQKLIGAIEWDGGQPSYKADVTGMEDISNEQYRASSRYDSRYQNWRDYVKSIDGKWPPMYCSFATYFNTRPDIEPSRKPINSIYSETAGRDVELGWWQSGYTGNPEVDVYNIPEGITLADVDTTLYETEKVEAQIDLAAEYGIDFFAMTFYVHNNDFDADGNIQEVKLKKFIANNWVYQYMAARNKWKVRFCLILMLGNLSRDKAWKFMQYVNEKFVSDSQYLYLNGAPLFLVYGNNENTGNLSFLKIKGAKILGQPHLDKKAFFDGYWQYSGSANEENETFEHFSSTILTNWDSTSKNNKDLFVMNTLCGRDDRGRYGYTKEAHHYVQKPTKDELRNALMNLIDLAEDRTSGDVALTIYAWNEFIEGGWLLPNQSEIESGYGYSKLEAIKEAKQYWITK